MFRFLHSLVYAPKYEKESDMKFFDEISVTIFTILLCMVCLTMSSWAYFTADVAAEGPTITAANYTVTVTVKDGSDLVINPETDGSYTLPAGTYTVTMTAAGTSVNPGFCKIIAGNTELFSQPLKTNADQATPTPDSQTVLLIVTAETKVTFTGMWGSAANTAAVLENGATVTLPANP